MIMRAASSNISRESPRSTRNALNSLRAAPRPMPRIMRPSLSMSSMMVFSTTRSGSFHGRMTAPVISLRGLRLRRDIGQDLEIVRARRVVGEMMFDRRDVVESHRLGLDGELGFSPEKFGIRHAMQILIPEL